jgi:hypothetical protein
MRSKKGISIPFLFLVIFGTGGILFFASFFVIENMIGSPSSTSALIIIPMIPISIIAGLLGGAFGYFVEGIMKFLKKGNPLQKKEIYFSGLVLSFVVFGIAIFAPLKLQLDWNAYNSPRIIIDIGLIQKAPFDSYTKNKGNNESSQCIIKFGQRQEGKGLFWNNKTYKVKFDEHGFVVLDDTGEPFIKQRLEGYDYIRELICLPLDMPSSSESLLAVFADLRATSKNSILHFFSPKGECIFQELVKNIGSVYLGYDLSSGETALVLDYYNLKKNVYKLRKTEKQNTI